MTGYVGPIQGVVHGIYDGPHATPPESGSGPVFLGIKNVTTEGRLDLSEIRHVSEEHYPKWTRRVTPQANDIVFSYEATLHRYAVIPEGFRGCLGRRMALLRPNPDRVIPRFLHYYLLSKNWRSVVESNTISGVTVDRIPLSRFPDFDISIPVLSVQRRVVSVLSAYDDLIENNRRRISLLEETARALYREWFVRLHFPGYQSATIVDRVPMGWKKQSLGEISNISMGQSPKSIYYNKDHDGLPFHQGVADFGIRFPSHRIYCTLQNRIAEKGDILFSVRAPVGRINLATTRMIVGRGIAAIRSNRCEQNFLFYALKNHFFKEDMIGGGSIFAAIAKKDLHGVILLQPPKHISEMFMEQVQPIDEQIETLHQTVGSLARVRDLFLPRFMSGEIEV